MSIQYLFPPLWDAERGHVFAEATFGASPRRFRVVVTGDFLAAGRRRPRSEGEALHLFELRRAIIERQWLTAARGAGPLDDELTVGPDGVRIDWRDATLTGTRAGGA